jgi:hypothetical protein
MENETNVNEPFEIVRAVTVRSDLYWKCPKCTDGVLNVVYERSSGSNYFHKCSNETCGNEQTTKDVFFPQHERTDPPTVSRVMWDIETGLFVGMFIVNKLGSVYVYTLDEDNEFVLIDPNNNNNRLSSAVLKESKFGWKAYVPSDLGLLDSQDLSDIFVMDDKNKLVLDYSKFNEVEISLSAKPKTSSSRDGGTF